MARRIVLALAIACAVSVQPAHAQLAKWCVDPTQGACFTVTAFEYAQFVDASGPEIWYDNYISLSGFWTGALVESSETINGFPTYWKFATDLAALGLMGQTSLHFGDTASFLGQVGTATHRYNVRQQLLKVPELSDVTGIWNANRGGCSVNTGVSAWAPCTIVNVPEPGSLLLLASGILPLALVGWRRRREATG